MIIKYVYNNQLYCIHYDNYKSFLKECSDPSFKSKLNDTKDVIVLLNDGCSKTFNNLKEVYETCMKNLNRR